MADTKFHLRHVSLSLIVHRRVTLTKLLTTLVAAVGTVALSVTQPAAGNTQTRRHTFELRRCTTFFHC